MNLVDLKEQLIQRTFYVSKRMSNLMRDFRFRTGMESTSEVICDAIAPNLKNKFQDAVDVLPNMPEIDKDNMVLRIAFMQFPGCSWVHTFPRVRPTV